MKRSIWPSLAALFVFAFYITLLTTTCWSQSDWRPAITEEGAVKTTAAYEEALKEKAQKLRERRFEKLRDAARRAVVQFREGTIDFDRALALHRSMIAAEVDAAASTEERIELLQQHLNMVAKFLAVNLAQFEGGAIAEIDVLQAQAMRDEIEIALIEEKRERVETTKPGTVEQAQKQADLADSKIRSIQAKRIKLLAHGVKLAEKHYREGARDFPEVFQLQIELMDAKLNVAESLDDKVEFLRSQLAVAKGSHVIALDRYQGGAGSELDVVRAKSLVLHIEIELLKLKRALGNQVDLQH